MTPYEGSDRQAAMGRKSLVRLFAVDCGCREARLRSVAAPNFLERMMVAPPPEDRLDSWKEIAAYLKRDVTTVQRWEKREGMPVHRHVHDKLGSIYAFRSELDDWARRRHAPDAERSVEEQATTLTPVASPPRKRMVLGVLGAAVLISAAGAAWLLTRHDDFLREPLTAARFHNVTDFGGTEQAAAVSRDGRFVAFLSDRDGRTDVWLTQIGVGQFYNLTRGRVPDLINPAVRTLGFSPDGALVTFWTRTNKGGDIGISAVPTLGGEPRPYLEDTAEYDWATDASRVVYHSAGPGDPTFVRKPDEQGRGQKIFEAAAGRHAHFQIWSPDGAFIYFVQGSPPDDMDIWRLRTSGGAAERITHHQSRVSHPVFLNRRTLLYLATDSDGSGPWLHTLDVDHPSPQRVDSGVNRYTSLAASADGGRLVASLSSPRSSLWRLPVVDGPLDAAAAQISLSTGSGFAPRLGANYLLYLSTSGAASGIWKLANGAVTELWSTTDGRIVGGPAIAPNGDRVAFCVAQHGRTLLYVMDAGGTNARVVTQSLELRGDPAWAPDGQSITASANVKGAPQLLRISLAGGTSPFVDDYAVDPAWSPGGDFLVYSGADIGTTFPVKAVTAAAIPYEIPALTLTRGGRRVRFLHGGRALVVMRGDLRHKDLWLIDLATGAERQLTRLPNDFDVRDFDVSPDGREIVLERVQEHSDIVLIDLARRP